MLPLPARLSVVNAALRFGLKPLLAAMKRPDLTAAEASNTSGLIK